MQSESQKDFNEILGTFGVSLSQFDSANWKSTLVSHAQGKIKDSVCFKVLPYVFLGM